MAILKEIAAVLFRILFYTSVGSNHKWDKKLMLIFHIYFEYPKHKWKLCKKVDDCLFQAVQEKNGMSIARAISKSKERRLK